MKPLAAAALLSLAILPSFASAEMPATIRGVVYSCDTGAIPNAYVWIDSLDDRTRNVLVTDARGSFARVGVTPGRYLVIVVGEIRSSNTDAVRGVSRLASVDTDDVLDVRIGTQLTPKPPPDLRYRDLNHVVSPRYINQPTTICDAAIVPPAPPTSDRYVIH
jgi:hypothetical protein